MWGTARTTSREWCKLIVLLAMTLLLGPGCVVSRRIKRQCEVIAIHAATSDVLNTTYMFNLTYNNDSCRENVSGWQSVRFESCYNNSTCGDGRQAKHEGKPQTCACTGWMRVSVFEKEKIYSNCFQCWGRNMKMNYSIEFTPKLLRIRSRVDHPALKTWNITTYMTKKKKKIKCGISTTYKTPMEEIKKRFQETPLQPTNVSRTEIIMERDFDPSAYYCFVLIPISHLRLMPEYIPISTPNYSTQGDSTAIGISTDGPLSMSSSQRTVLVLVTGSVLLVVAVLSIIINKPRMLSILIGLKRLIVRQEGSSSTAVLARGADVLLLYAADVRYSEHLADLKQHLHADFNVHDVHDHSDVKRLEDVPGWMVEQMLPTAGLKLLVESKGLEGLINTLLETHNAADESSKAMVTHTSRHAKTAENLLTFALGIILDTELQEDYSTVFVVRFPDEVKKAVDKNLGRLRRFRFPDHIVELKNGMMAACQNSSSDGYKWDSKHLPAK